jgi:ABC-type methionine transport system ATPase subunit
MTDPHSLNLDTSDRNRATKTRIRIHIPKKYHQEPIVFNLASQHHLEVNILSAVLGKNAVGDGWFDLELCGKSRNIDSALLYLAELDVQVWHDSDHETDGW